MINLGGVGRAFKRVVSAPFKAIGKVLGFGNTADVSAPDVSAAQVVPSTASTVPESPALGTEKKKKKKGKASLLINSDNSRSSGNSSYSGLNI